MMLETNRDKDLFIACASISELISAFGIEWNVCLLIIMNLLNIILGFLGSFQNVHT